MPRHSLAPEARADSGETRADRARGSRLRLGLVFWHQANKQGSLEDWILACSHAATARGHAVDVLTLAPVLPDISRELEQCGAVWRDLATLVRHPGRALRAFHAYDIVHLNFLAPRSSLAVAACLARPGQVIWSDHSSLLESEKRRSPWWRSSLDRLCLRFLGRVVGVSNYVADRDRRRFGNSRKVTMIYNGVDTSRFHPALAAPAPLPQPDEAHIAVAANLIYGKGVDGLLEALAPLRHEPWRLTVAGTGEEEKNLRELTARLQLVDRVAFVGLRSDLDVILRTTDIFVHPARWEEAFGLTVAEAMASGVAVIAGRGGALSELIEHEVSGLLVTRDNVPELTAALRRLLYDPEFRQTLGRAARARAVAQFSLTDCVDRYLDLYEQVAYEHVATVP